MELKAWLSCCMLLQGIFVFSNVADASLETNSQENGGTPAKGLLPGETPAKEDATLPLGRCAKACSDQLSETWPLDIFGVSCHNNHDCYLCWEFCKLLQQEHNRESLCNRTECGSGCQAACNIVQGKGSELQINLGYLTWALIFMAFSICSFFLCFYLMYLLRDNYTNQEIQLPEVDDTLSWQELQMLDFPQAEKTRTNYRHLQVRMPISQSVLRLLEDKRESVSPPVEQKECQLQTKVTSPVISLYADIPNIDACYVGGSDSSLFY